MNVWVKDNAVSVSIVTFFTFLIFVIVTTLTYAEKEGLQTQDIKEVKILAMQNQKDICELTDIVKSHVVHAEKAAVKTIKIESDVDHIKGDIQEIKYMLRRQERNGSSYKYKGDGAADK